MLLLSKVKKKKELQVRLNGVNNDTVEQYEAELAAGAQFPPLVCFRVENGDLLLVDGYHRYEAYKRLGVEEAEAEVLEGSYEDALDYTRFEANRTNGQRLSRADLWALVEAVVVDPRYFEQSDHQLAKLCRCTGPTVAAARQRVGLSPEQRTGADGKVRSTTGGACETTVLNITQPPAGPQAPEDGGRGVLGSLLVERLSDHVTDLETSKEKLRSYYRDLDEESLEQFTESVYRLVEVTKELSEGSEREP